MDGLANLPNLRSLDLYGCKSVEPKPSVEQMTTRAEVAAYQAEIINSEFGLSDKEKEQLLKSIDIER